jgi:hypothetical protein
MKTAILLPIIVFSLLFTSCDPQKRLHRLLIKYPDLISKDTITVKDTVIIESSRVDTVINYDSLSVFDTITLTRDNLTVRLIKIHDTLLLSGECKGDTIYIEKKVVVDRIKYEKPNILSKNLPYILIVAGLFALFLLILLIKSLFK